MSTARTKLNFPKKNHLNIGRKELKSIECDSLYETIDNKFNKKAVL